MQETSPEADAARAGRVWVWPMAVVGMLAVSMTVCAITVVAAVGDPSYAVEDDYYQKAVDWDHSREIQIASEGLGWHADTDLTAGDGALTVTLKAADGTPVIDASVRAMVFHHARRSDAQELVLQSRGDGRYTALVDRPREGEWQLRLRASRGRDRFVLTQDIFTRGRTP